MAREEDTTTSEASMQYRGYNIDLRGSSVGGAVATIGRGRRPASLTLGRDEYEAMQNARDWIDRQLELLDEAILVALVNAVGEGHDLEPFEPTDSTGREYQARCRCCGWTVRVNERGRSHSMLEQSCRESAS